MFAIPPSAEEDPEIRRIWDEFGVRVHVNYDRDSYFSAKLATSTISARGMQIEPSGAKR